MFTPDDLNKCKALKTILKGAKHELKGDAICLVASLFNWFDDLESRLEKTVNKPKKTAVKK